MSDRMRDITYDEWKDQTKKTFAWRSRELKAVDDAFKTWERARTEGVKTQALQELARVYKLWITLKGDDFLESTRNRKENAEGFGPVERLQSLIRTHKSSNVAIIRDLHAEAPDRLVLDASLQNLKDKTKVKECFDRSGRAVHVARDTLIKAGSAGTPSRTLYERWFGAYDATRHATVMGNFKGLCDLFDIGVVIVHDARTQAGFWGDCFGFAMPGNKKNYVEFTVGRSFFLKQGFDVAPGATLVQRSQAVQQALAEAYANLGDWTVGTMVHELSHAANGSPDVDFQAPSTYQISPGGQTPVGWDQCSTPALDLALAIARPDLAVQNVDSYGQCSREALQAAGQ